MMFPPGNRGSIARVVLIIVPKNKIFIALIPIDTEHPVVIENRTGRERHDLSGRRRRNILQQIGCDWTDAAWSDDVIHDAWRTCCRIRVRKSCGGIDWVDQGYIVPSKIPIPLRCARNNGDSRRGLLVISQPLIGTKDEHLALDDWTARSGAELVLHFRRNARGKVIFRIEYRISQELPRGPVNMLVPALEATSI